MPSATALRYKRRKAAKRKYTTKYIRRNTGAKAQSRQIAQLTRQVRTLARSNTERICTRWQRSDYPIQTLTTSGAPYICPIPYNCMDPFDQYDPGSGLTTRWRDSLGIGGQSIGAYFVKTFNFAYSQNAMDSNCIRHTGGVIKWQMSSTEPDMSKVSLFLVRPKQRCADQLMADRGLLGDGTVPFGPKDPNANLVLGDDYVCHDGQHSTGAPSTYFGAQMNPKWWSVLYHREITFGHPNAAGFQQNATANNASPANNALTASGTIKLPAAGLIKSASKSRAGPTNDPDAAVQLGLLDQRNEDQLFLVAVQNGVTADNESITLGFMVLDYYDASV